MNQLPKQQSAFPVAARYVTLLNANPVCFVDLCMSSDQVNMDPVIIPSSNEVCGVIHFQQAEEYSAIEIIVVCTMCMVIHLSTLSKFCEGLAWEIQEWVHKCA